VSEKVFESFFGVVEMIPKAFSIHMLPGFDVFFQLSPNDFFEILFHVFILMGFV
jgi:hypothetical protein